jgi:hypothetical protein
MFESESPKIKDLHCNSTGRWRAQQFVPMLPCNSLIRAAAAPRDVQDLLDRDFLRPADDDGGYLASAKLTKSSILAFLISSPTPKSKVTSHAQPHAALRTSPSIYRGRGWKISILLLLLRVLVWRRDQKDRCTGTWIADMALD